MSQFNIGVIAGNFDVIHPGYIQMFNQMSEVCNEVVILLQTDPTVERPEKIKPILSVKDRIQLLLSLKQIDRVITYTTEEELENILIGFKPDVRFLGDDYRTRTDYTGYGLDIPIYFLDRSHGWSTTKFKQLIAKTV